jgi:hypothetical protein
MNAPGSKRVKSEDAERAENAKHVAETFYKRGSSSKSKQDHGEMVAKLRRNQYLRDKQIDPSGPFQLEVWPEVFRAIPNDYARSALFTVRNKKEPRAVLQQHTLFHVEKAVQITFTGIELRAEDDELVWQQILNYAKHHTLGEPVKFNLHALLQDLGWSINKRNYDKARMCISRLKASEVKVENERFGTGSAISLIHAYKTWSAKGEFGAGAPVKFEVYIHPELMLLFAGKQYTLVAWERYRELTPTARRLYDYVGSHREPYALRLETFKAMCGSTTKDKYKWRQAVQTAGDELVDAGLVHFVNVADDKIFCQRTSDGEPAPVRRLAKRRSRSEGTDDQDDKEIAQSKLDLSA